MKSTFAVALVAFRLLTTDVLALVLRAMWGRSVQYCPGLFCFRRDRRWLSSLQNHLRNHRWK